MHRQATRVVERVPRVVPASVALLAATALLAGCGGDDDYANAARPPAPLTISAVITERGVELSPREVGGGPLVITIANETARSRTAVIEAADAGGVDVRRSTDPIDPSSTGQLRIDATRGSYTVAAGGSSIPSATLTVGAPRNSAQNELLQP